VTKTYARRGVKYGRYQTFANRWGEGKVHLYVYRREHKEWVLGCRFNDVGSFGSYHGKQLDDAHVPVTCKKCLKVTPE
jgi:hypothetical protein